MVHFPGFASYGYVFTIRYLMFNQVGSPIRISPDRRMFASPRGFSQLTTSFFACLCLGIPTYALSSLTIKSISIHRLLFVLILSLIAAKPLPNYQAQPDGSSNFLWLPINIQFSKIYNTSRSQ